MGRLALALLLGLWAGAANAQEITKSIGTASTNYALDGMGTVSRAYGFRRLLTSYSTSKLVNIVRASDSGTSDIGFTATGDFDTATATTFCNATTCKVVTLYDQSGNAANLTQGTDANRPALIASCLGSRYCWRTTSGSISISAGANFTPATGSISFSAVAKRTSGTGACFFISANGGSGDRMTGGSGVANRFGAAPYNLNAVASDAAWHAAQLVGGAIGATLWNIDGVDTAAGGTAGGNTTAGTPTIVGTGSTTCDGVESAFLDNVALSAGQRAILNANQRAWWGL